MKSAQSAAEITVFVNAEELRLPAGSTVQTLRQLREYPDHGIAIAVNRQVIPRSRHHRHVLRDGDRIEAVRAVGGG